MAKEDLAPATRPVSRF